ncbi:MAG: tRNA (adenosine(37)-N6)-threonylcarbamoyltransferase complex dimerization subunit type 1 TsaB, partial [Coriobacteriales bacterium]|nr:tRNA (adenosine(37)-N6)-threonylcarbamoyltransferase complex dimerization subunit type 1 TsaB [Coriobacteriales bacterium]
MTDSGGIVLAFDTASENIALAVGRRASLEVVASKDQRASRQANVRLMPAIAALFDEHELTRDDISCVVCGLGPGSFTGVRIGVATAKGLARGLGVPLFGVSTLDAVAWGAWLAGLRGKVGIVADAMRGEVYPARFLLDDSRARRLDPHTVSKADAVAAAWREAGDALLLLGDGLEKYAEAFVGETAGVPTAGVAGAGVAGVAGPLAASAPAAAAPLFTLGPSELYLPTGAGLLAAFKAACAEGREGSGEIGALLPIYTRLSDAEENERARLAADGARATAPLAASCDILSASSEGSGRPAVSYRPMSAADLDAVCALEAACFPAGASTSGERWSREALAGDVARADGLWGAAISKGGVVGCAGGWVAAGELQG